MTDSLGEVEGFKSSNSLALGLSDHVKAFSGGVHLEAIFIEEGFGTLGPEGLDAVMTLLHDLQTGGRWPIIGFGGVFEATKTGEGIRCEMGY